MKKLFTLLIALLICNFIFAQTLYTRTDTIQLTNDSVTFQAGQFRGILQWQHSLDGHIWKNLKGKTDQSLKVSKAAEGHYRAEIIDSNCFPTYSDTALIQSGYNISKYINAEIGGTIVAPDKTTLIIPAGALQTSGDIRISTITDENLPIIPNKDLVDFGGAYEIQFSGDSLLKSVTLSFVLDSLPERIDNYMLFLYNGNSYFPIEYTIGGDTVTITIDIINWETSFSEDYQKTLRSINLFSPIIIRKLYSSQTPPIEQMGLKEVSLSNGELIFSSPGIISNNDNVLLLVHGWRDKPKTWTSFIKKMNAQTEVKFSKIWTYGYNSSWSIDQNASELSLALSNYTGNATVKIVAHSMGGLVSRAMIEYNSGAKFVKKLITLGTPHLGTPVAALRNFLGTIVKMGETESTLIAYNNKTEGFRDLQDNSLFIQKMKGITQPLTPYYCIAGISSINLPLVPGSDDGVVSVSSAIGVPNAKAKATFNIDSKVAHLALLDNETVFKKVIEYLIDRDTLIIVQGNNQVGKPGKQLTDTIIVQILDSEGKPIKNRIVYFETDFGHVDNSTPKSNDEGKVYVLWTLGTSVGEHLLYAYLKDDNNEKLDYARLSIISKICGCDIKNLDSFTDSRDGKTYKTIKIGSQTWLKPNWRVNWDDALNRCPSGWHLPSNNEWDVLINYLGGIDIAPVKMLTSPCGTNESCFSATPYGYSWTWGKYQVVDMGCCYWTSDEGGDCATIDKCGSCCAFAWELKSYSDGSTLLKKVSRYKNDIFEVSYIKD